MTKTSGTDALEELARAIDVELAISGGKLPGGVFPVNLLLWDGLRAMAEEWCRENDRVMQAAEIDRQNFIWRGVPVVIETTEEALQRAEGQGETPTTARRRGFKHVRTLKPGENWRLLPDGRILIVHPERPPITVAPDGTETEISVTPDRTTVRIRYP